MKHTLIIAALVAATPNLSAAQVIKDPEQRHHWYALQRLATEAFDLASCGAVVSEDGSVWDAYYRKTDEYAKAVESYITRYAISRSSRETVDSFRYRVWHIRLREGQDSAAGRDALTPTVCRLMSK